MTILKYGTILMTVMVRDIAKPVTLRFLIQMILIQNFNKKFVVLSFLAEKNIENMENLKQATALFLSVSNFAALPIFALKLHLHEFTLVYMMICSSILMHLSERKHHFNGVSGFRGHVVFKNQVFNFSQLALWLDRILGCGLVCLCNYYICRDNIPLGLEVLDISVAGLCCLFLSENFFTQDKATHIIMYGLTHCWWHLAAYYSLYFVLSKRVF